MRFSTRQIFDWIFSCHVSVGAFLFYRNTAIKAKCEKITGGFSAKPGTLQHRACVVFSTGSSSCAKEVSSAIANLHLIQQASEYIMIGTPLNYRKIFLGSCINGWGSCPIGTLAQLRSYPEINRLLYKLTEMESFPTTGKTTDVLVAQITIHCVGQVIDI